MAASKKEIGELHALLAKRCKTGMMDGIIS